MKIEPQGLVLTIPGNPPPEDSSCAPHWGDLSPSPRFTNETAKQLCFLAIIPGCSWNLLRKRRKFLRAICFLLCFLIAFASTAPAESYPLMEEDRALLQMVQKDSFAYFQKYIHPRTGLVLDSSSPGSPSSIAATGFGLAALGIAHKHGWVGYREGYQTAERILRTLESKADTKNGFYYHFLNPENGKRAWVSEVSSIDTALLAAGLLLAGDYFKGTKVERHANRLYERINWPWMLNGSYLLSHGWKPERGFLPYYWDTYSEHLILLALAMGSPTFPIPRRSWDEWLRHEDEYNGKKIIYSFTGSLFTYQFPHAFIDFRNLSDRGINYFENSRLATLANREFCWDQRAEFPSYSETVWGLSASLGPRGYKAYGAKPGLALHDGTVAPYSIAASVVFTPAESIESLRTIYDRYGEKVYGPYGFRDAFNADQGWWTNDYLGIDQGIVVVMLENFLNDGDVWNRFMNLPAVKRWVKRANLASEKNEPSPREVRAAPPGQKQISEAASKP